MEQRSPYQGVANVIRFNWPIYALAGGLMGGLGLLAGFGPKAIVTSVLGAMILLLATLAAGLLVSWYVYDRSALYRLEWLDRLTVKAGGQIVNISAGFDEFSLLLEQECLGTKVIPLDFYDPRKHTEPSIKRARKAYPASADTQLVSTQNLGLESNSADLVSILFSAHEIRDRQERSDFFREVARVSKPNCPIVVSEHLRDVPNLLAYNLGFLHFHSRRSWLATFQAAGLEVRQEFRITPFVTTFVLGKP